MFRRGICLYLPAALSTLAIICFTRLGVACRTLAHIAEEAGMDPFSSQVAWTVTNANVMRQRYKD
jgi:hypothetical protein